MSGLGRGTSRIQRGGRRPPKSKETKTANPKELPSKSITQRTYSQVGSGSESKLEFKEPLQNRQKFGFESEKEVKELEPLIKHELSRGCFIQYIPNFYSAEEEERLFRKLIRRLPFKQQDNLFDGRVFSEPRLSCWFGEYPYGYNPLLRHDATNIADWPSVLRSILSKIKSDPNLAEDVFEINSVLCNLYRHDKDKMGWHSDNESELGNAPTIISLRSVLL